MRFSVRVRSACQSPQQAEEQTVKVSDMNTLVDKSYPKDFTIVILKLYAAFT